MRNRSQENEITLIQEDLLKKARKNQEKEKYNDIMNKKYRKLSKGDKIRTQKQNKLIFNQMKKVTDESKKVIQDLHDGLNEVRLRQKLPHLKESEIEELKKIEFNLFEQINLLV